MRLQKLRLANFKNYEEINLQFPSKINVLTGINGSGKTNLLDAVYYLSFTKSAFQHVDPQNIRHGQDYFFIKGDFSLETATHEVSCGFQVKNKKSFREDGVEYQKLSEHIGKYPVVLIAPDDTDLVKEGSETRRRFFDSIISQIDRPYLENLIRYNQALKQRNGLLKMFQDTGRTDWTALEAYDHVLITTGVPVYQRRKAFIDEFIRIFARFFNFLVSEKEVTSLHYNSGLAKASFAEGLQQNRSKDMALQRTSFGIHRDEYDFFLGDTEMKRFGSQGQQKSFVIAMKLAQWQLIREIKGFKPVLLLDDIFDKLDDFRIARLLELIKEEFGQLFITDARPDRTQALLDNIQVSATVFHVNQGSITPL